MAGSAGHRILHELGLGFAAAIAVGTCLAAPGRLTVLNRRKGLQTVFPPMPSITKKTRRPSRLPADFDEPEGALRSAALATAMLAATDEEFAAGVPLSDPGSILSGSRSAPEGEPNKPPGKKSKAEKIIKKYAAAKKKAAAPRRKADPKKLKAGFERIAKLKRNSELLASKSKKKA